ncbi:MAG: hypothetical protein J5634_01475 [Bacilli bacterium]|nr:hypothetical protein [Bacilli bacterium]
MNLDIIKDKIKNKINSSVIITVKGIRNKKQIYEGKIYKLYPNIFSILTRNGEKSFSYADVVTKDILIKYI